MALSDILSGIMGAGKDLVMTGGQVDLQKVIPLLGVGASLTGLTDAQQRPTGYQGGIPDYTATREVVPQTFDPDRRPGSGGQRYFTDTQYTASGNMQSKFPTAAELAQQNATNPANDWNNFLSTLAGLSRPSSSGGSGGSGGSAGGGSGVTNKTGGAADAGWMEESQNFSDDKWRDIMDVWAAQNPNATKAQVDNALLEFGVPSRLYGYAYSKSGVVNNPAASQGLGAATADTGFVTPGAPTGPGGADLYGMLQETIRYAPSAGSAGGSNVSKQEVDQIWDLAKTLGLSIPQITELVNMNMPGAGITAGQVVDAIRWAAPDEADTYLQSIGGSYDPTKRYASGGIAQGARYLRGATDGMADKIPAAIDGEDPAALSHGEFVVPADVVGHLGNGNSEAGAKVLYDMMDRIRMSRTGRKEQAPPVNPRKLLPA